MVKRTLDFLMALLGLLLLAAPMALTAALVKLCSHGPIFYGSKRCGRGGTIFTLWKFRTMRTDAGANGPRVTARGDPRITWLGRFLRKTKLDELPQLWNVLLGDISLVGPRPEAPKYVQLEDNRWREILSVRPGITGLATLEFTDEEAILEGADAPEREYMETVQPVKMELWLKYARQRSFWGDMLIVLRTVGRLFRRERNTGQTRLRTQPDGKPDRQA